MTRIARRVRRGRCRGVDGKPATIVLFWPPAQLHTRPLKTWAEMERDAIRAGAQRIADDIDAYILASITEYRELLHDAGAE